MMIPLTGFLTVQVPEGQYYLVLAEMKLYAYEVAGQGRKYFVLSTGNVYAGPYGKGDLANQLLDDSLLYIAKEFGLTTKSRDQIANGVSNPVQVSGNLDSPIPDVWYRIKNTQYPGNSFILYFSNSAWCWPMKCSLL